VPKKNMPIKSLFTIAGLAVASSILFTSCSNDIDLLDEYKPITVVYGLLNPQENVQYVKVNKAFLGEGNALLMARQSDSINYHTGELDVYLQKEGNSNLIHLIETTSIPKDEGIFGHDYQLLFSTNATLDPLATYSLIINRHSDATTITASTKLIDDVTILTPASTTSPINLYSITNQSYTDQPIIWMPESNAKIYEVMVRLTYYETPVSQPGNTDTLTLDYNLGSVVMLNMNDNNQQTLRLEGEKYFIFISTSIHSTVPVIRTASDSLQIFLSAGTEDLYTYMLVNQPSIGLVQERPVYSNINNGTGIFAGRYKKILKRKMHINTFNELRNGQYTGNLFQ
jgi:hypothetical protein